MKYCSKHHPNPDDALFCNECGEKLINIIASKKCPKCGSSNPKDAVFCHNCGKDLKEEVKENKIKSQSQNTYTATSSHHKTTNDPTEEYLPLGCGLVMIVISVILLCCGVLKDGVLYVLFIGVVASISAIYRWLKK